MLPSHGCGELELPEKQNSGQDVHNVLKRKKEKAWSSFTTRSRGSENPCANLKELITSQLKPAGMCITAFTVRNLYPLNPAASADIFFVAGACFGCEVNKTRRKYSKQRKSSVVCVRVCVCVSPVLTSSVFVVITVDLKDDYCYSCTPPSPSPSLSLSISPAHSNVVFLTPCLVLSPSLSPGKHVFLMNRHLTLQVILTPRLVPSLL